MVPHHDVVRLHDRDDANSPSRYYARMRNLAILAAVLFVLALCAALVQFQLRSEQAVRDGIVTQARAHASEFNAVRTYVQGFTGIYVPASEEVTVNPHLMDIKGVTPSISTTSGKTFVLQNSPLVARQVSQILEKDTVDEPVLMRIYGKKPLNPDNEPTPFAANALTQLQGGAKTVTGYGRSGDTEVFRYALGIPANEKCGKCHENLVGKKSGIVGVTVVQMDVTRPLAYVKNSRTWTGEVILAIILASIVVMYFFVTRVLKDMYRAQSQVYEMARRDSLTGLASRNVGMTVLEDEIVRAIRERRPLACCVIDLDDFKSVNDALGHHVGDRVLGTVGTAIAAHLRTYDVAARVGGEEFLVVLPGTDSSEAMRIGERIRGEVTVAARAVEQLDRPLTCTVGIAVLDPTDPVDPEDARAFYIRADEALLMAKHQGKDRVVLAPAARDDDPLARSESLSPR